MNAKTILVTGGCGFIGSHIVEALVNKGFKVRVFDDLSSGKLDNITHLPSQNIEICIGNITDLSLLDSVIEGCAYIFHEAAIASVPKSINDPLGTGQVNYGGTMNVLESARKHHVKRVVFAGSAAVYGDEETLPKHESMTPHPLTPYAADKLSSEVMGRIHQQFFGVEFVSLRYFNVFGLRQDPSSPYSGVISIFCDRILQGLTPTIYGDGLQSRDFIHISDVVSANLLAMQHPKAVGKVFNVGRNEATTLLDIWAILNELTGQDLKPLFNAPRLGDIRHSLADNTALKELGWSPLKTIRDGLAELLQAKE